jgi:hypothetical protein
MKLLFSKEDFHGQWFQDDESPEGFTEKVPPHTGVLFDETLGDWVLKPQEPQAAPAAETDDAGEEVPEPGI